MNGPAYRIETPRLVLRCWNPADAALLEAAMAKSVEHLKPWMPWAHHEPVSRDDRVQLLRTFRSAFDADQDHVYGIFNFDETEVVGGTGLHPRSGAGIREIGYWIRGDRLRRGYAAEAAAALTRVAFEVGGLQRVEIRCDPKNEPSAAVPRKLAFVHEATLRRQSVDVAGHPRDTMLWSLVRDEYPGSPASEVDTTAYDVTGERVL